MSPALSCKFCEMISVRKLAAMQVSGGLVDPHDAYRANLRLSGRLWPLIALLEVGIRNRFAEAMEDKFGRDFFLKSSKVLDTRLNEKLGFASSQAEAKGLSGKREAIISSLSFGFWTMMLNRRSESKIWVPALRHAFRGNRVASRQLYFEKLRQVTVLRNRIAHHENILNYDENSEIENILWLLEALEPGSSQFAKLEGDILLHPVE